MGLTEPEYLSRLGRSKAKTDRDNLEAVIDLPKITDYSSLQSKIKVDRCIRTRATKSAKLLKVPKSGIPQ